MKVSMNLECFKEWFKYNYRAGNRYDIYCSRLEIANSLVKSLEIIYEHKCLNIRKIISHNSISDMKDDVVLVIEK